MAQIFNEAGTAPANIVHNENFQKVIDNALPQQTDEDTLDNLFGNDSLGLLPLQGTVDEFLRELDPAERRFFNQLSKEGKLKTICKLG